MSECAPPPVGPGPAICTDRSAPRPGLCTQHNTPYVQTGQPQDLGAVYNTPYALTENVLPYRSLIVLSF